MGFKIKLIKPTYYKNINGQKEVMLMKIVGIKIKRNG